MSADVTIPTAVLPAITTVLVALGTWGAIAGKWGLLPMLVIGFLWIVCCVLIARNNSLRDKVESLSGDLIDLKTANSELRQDNTALRNRRDGIY